MNDTNTPIDITAFDAVQDSDNGYEFELKNPDGVTGTGIFLKIVGSNSDAVVGWFSKVINANNIESQMAARKGKTVPPKSVEENKAQNLDLTVTRVVGWRNVAQPFSKTLLTTVLQKNPHWVQQITDESDNLGNFTK